MLLLVVFSHPEDSLSKPSVPLFPSGFPVQPRKELTPSHPEPSPDQFLLTCFSLLYWFSVQFPCVFLPRLQVPSTSSLPLAPHCFAFKTYPVSPLLCQIPGPIPFDPILLVFQATSSTRPGFSSCAHIMQMSGLRIRMLMRT